MKFKYHFTQTRKNVMRKYQLITLPISLILILLLIQCKKENSVLSQSNVSISSKRLDEQKLPEDFNFSTYQDGTLKIFSDPQTTFKVYGMYRDDDEELLSTIHSKNGEVEQRLSFSTRFSSLRIVAHNETGQKEKIVSNSGGQSFHIVDFTGTGKTNSSAVPTNVLYAVNSDRDFLLVSALDYSYQTLPQLLQGTIACAVDTFNNWVYYHNSGNMYKYDIVSQTHSLAYTNANPFGSGNFPRMEFDCNTQHLFMSNSSTSIKEVDPLTGNVIATYTIQGLVNGSGGGDLTFPPDGNRYLACFSGLYKLDFSVGNGIVQATRISAENMPYQLTSAGYDRQGFLYACTNDTQSKMLKMDPSDGSYVIVKTFPMRINDLGSVVSFSNSICTADSDNDGVCDELDDFPDDSTVCCGQYTPSQLGSGSLAFEDLWPTQGDYDFNDLVVGYNYVQMKNSNDEVVRIKANFQVKAVGASYHNGFGFQIDLNPSDIASISGSRLNNGIVNVDAKGLEIGQSKSTIIVFDDAFDVITHVGGPYINTDPNQALSIGEEIEIVIELNQNLSGSFQPENPFIFVDGDRTHEVHLGNESPTDLANIALLGTLSDHSAPENNIYYKNENNVPWGIDISHNFRYPREKIRIDEGYNYIVNWAMSEGIAYPDWYKDNSGYRNENKLYMKH